MRSVIITGSTIDNAMKKHLYLLLVLLSACSAKQQNDKELSLNSGSYMDEMHEKHSGEIVFMNDFISYADFEEYHIKSSLPYNEILDFNMRMFLDKTLTHYLSELAPELSVNELCDKGNFQFTFSVGGEEIWEHNLPVGAGSCEYKNQMTVYGIPLVHKDNPEHWGRYMWMKFLKRNGGQEALVGNNHTLTVDVRPYLEDSEFKTGNVIASGKVRLVRSDIEIDDDLIAIQKVKPFENWSVNQTGVNQSVIEDLNSKIALNYFKNINSIAVIQNSEIVLEQYFNGYNRESLHDVRSVSKTLVALFAGIAIEQGHIENVDEPISNYYELGNFHNYTKLKDSITIHDLLTMSSVFDGDDSDFSSPGNEEKMYPSENWVKFVLDLPAQKQETNWSYFTGGVVLLGDILNKAAPVQLEKFADNSLFKPLNITDYKWQYTPQGVPNTAGSFQLSTLDYAKIGSLYLNNGRYDNSQIIPEAWMIQSMEEHEIVPDRDKESYGYLIWKKHISVENKDMEVHYMSGNGGNKVWIIPSLDAVIVLTSTAYGQPYMHYQAEEILKEYLIPALKGSDI